MSRGPIPDDFDMPTPQRETLWTLPDKKRAQMARQTQPRDPNNASDIIGASHGTTATYVRMQKFTTKPDLFSSTTIEGACPRRLVPIEGPKNSHLVDKSLMTKDLGPAASPNAQQFQTKRCTDPLQPQYVIPQRVVAPRNTDGPITHQTTLQQQQAGFGTQGVYGNESHNASLSGALNASLRGGNVLNGGGNRSGTNSAMGIYGSTFNPNFSTGHYMGTVRDVLQIDDIKGTRAADNRSNQVIRTHSPARDPINYNDIPFSTAGSSRAKLLGGGASGLHANVPHHQNMSLVTSDICKKDRNVVMQSTRNTNPLQPTYTVTGSKGATTTIGDVAGSKPKAPASLRTDRPMLSLRSDDIEGAQPTKRFS